MKIYLRVKLSKRMSNKAIKSSKAAAALRVKKLDKNWQKMRLKGGIAKDSLKTKPSIWL